MTMLELDERRRASLGKIGRKEHSLYRAVTLDDGTIILSPAVVMSERELALLSNPERVASIKRGIDEARAGLAQPVDRAALDELGPDDED